MLFRLALFLAVAAGAFVLWRRYQQLKLLMPPVIPDSWRDVASQDAHVREALDLWERLLKLARRDDNTLGNDFLEEVHSMVRGVVDMAALRIDLERHLRGLHPERLPEGGRTTVEELQSRAANLEAQAAETTGELRQLYLELLDNITGHDAEAAHGTAVARARRNAERLRVSLRADAELRRYLDEDEASASVAEGGR
jgi:hypothetical protein